jgi:hypothetical protein
MKEIIIQTIIDLLFMDFMFEMLLISFSHKFLD